MLFIDAVREVTRERAQSFLTMAQQQRILSAYQAFTDEPGFAKVATLADIDANTSNLSIPLYVKRSTGMSATDANGETLSLKGAWEQWQSDRHTFWQQMDALVDSLDSLATTGDTK